MSPLDLGPGIVADVTLMRTGAVELARLVDELVSMAADAAALPLAEPSLAARRDRLVDSLGNRIVALAVLADRIRRDADALTAVEQQAERRFVGLSQVLGTGAADGR